MDGARELNTIPFIVGTFNGVTYSLPPAGTQLTLGSAINVTDSAGKSLNYNGLGATGASEFQANSAPVELAVDDALAFAANQTGWANVNLLDNDNGNGLKITSIDGQSLSKYSSTYGYYGTFDVDEGRVFITEKGKVYLYSDSDFNKLKLYEGESLTLVLNILFVIAKAQKVQRWRQLP